MRFLSSGGLVVMTIYRSMDIKAVVSRKQTDSRQMVQVYVENSHCRGTWYSYSIPVAMTRYWPLPDSFSVASSGMLGSASRSPSAKNGGKLELQACPKQLFLALRVDALQLFKNSTRVRQEFLNTALNHTNVLIIMKLAMSKYFQCERSRVANIEDMFITPWHGAGFLRTRTTGLARIDIVNGYFDIELMIHIQPPDLGQMMKINIGNLHAIHLWCQLTGHGDIDMLKGSYVECRLNAEIGI